MRNKCAYGKGGGDQNITLMTLFQAKCQVKHLNEGGPRIKRRIYKLVPIEQID